MFLFFYRHRVQYWQSVLTVKYEQNCTVVRQNEYRYFYVLAIIRDITRYYITGVNNFQVLSLDKFTGNHSITVASIIATSFT